MALANAGVESILAICSVGAISSDFQPGSVGYANQYIDFTGVESTFSNEDAKFTSMTEPLDAAMNDVLDSVLSIKLQPGLKLGRTYIASPWATLRNKSRD